MPQQALELILMRQLASYLTLPIWIAGPDEKLLYYNHAAEPLLGRPFAEMDTIHLEDLAAMFDVTGDDGSRLAADALPLGIALRQRRPAHGALTFRALDGAQRKIEVTAFPLEGQGGRHLGAVAIFWEADP